MDDLSPGQGEGYAEYCLLALGELDLGALGGLGELLREEAIGVDVEAVALAKIRGRHAPELGVEVGSAQPAVASRGEDRAIGAFLREEGHVEGAAAEIVDEDDRGGLLRDHVAGLSRTERLGSAE